MWLLLVYINRYITRLNGGHFDSSAHNLQSQTLSQRLHKILGGRIHSQSRESLKNINISREDMSKITSIRDLLFCF